jgi:protein O-GlcNAc transferase
MLLLNQALDALNNRRFKEAETLFRNVLSKDANNFDALHILGIVCSENGKVLEAENFFLTALSIDSGFPPLFYNYGLFLAKQKRYQESIEHYDKAIGLHPNYADAHSGRGNALLELRRCDDALAAFDKALALKPSLENAWLGRGNVLAQLGRHDDALAAYDRALALKPSLENAWLGRGNVFGQLRRYDDALAAYDKAVAIKPDLESAWLGRGNVFLELRRHDDAFAAFDKALAHKPDLENAWLGRGNLFLELKRYDDAFAAYDKALSLKPDLAEALYGRGNTFTKLKRYDEAFAAFDKAYAIKPDVPSLESSRFHTKMHLCDWNNFDTECAHLISTVKGGLVDVAPFPLLAIASSSADQLQCAGLWTANRYRPSDKPIWRGERYHHDRIRVAYLSADFCDHPVAYLLAGVFEQHDRTRFETTAISFGPGSRDAMTTRLKKAFDRFVDVSGQSDIEVAQSIRALDVDIAVDLMGHTADSRTRVLACRPSPVQVNYLGYPGTMGAKYIDYIIADHFVIPEERREFYAEKVVYLPSTYMGNDSTRAISGRVPTRAECGLPESAFVFCSFNNSYKIAPQMFGIWMRLLHRVDNSVLWLLNMHETAVDHLRREAHQRGVDPARLVFAQRVALNEDHLARHRVANLFLDTLPYNAHTTASDALWAGLPVLTLLGETLAGRVAASLLDAIGLPELITTTLENYEALAIELATHPEKLASIKHKLTENRLTTPLFDTKRFTGHIEAAYAEMHERQLAGLAPDHIVIPKSTTPAASPAGGGR